MHAKGICNQNSFALVFFNHLNVLRPQSPAVLAILVVECEGTFILILVALSQQLDKESEYSEYYDDRVELDVSVNSGSVEPGDEHRDHGEQLGEVVHEGGDHEEVLRLDPSYHPVDRAGALRMVIPMMQDS